MTDTNMAFEDLNLPTYLLKTINELGYINPSPIQQKCIPYLLDGKDVLGIAQTGSGKTAAFSLPLLTKINIKEKKPQLLVMAPTRELAIQVAEATEQFGKKIDGINTVTLYGGQRYDIQLRALKKGSHVVVGTPGRLLDHIRRGTLDLSALKAIVLDEADEMLRMGFIDDVETIMSELPVIHQTALFSATMPDRIKKIAQKFMNDPIAVKIKASNKTAPDIEQVYCMTKTKSKEQTLLRFLEVENYDAAIIFVKTKSATLEVTELLTKNGFNAAALNGDMTQQLREQTLNRLKKGYLNILIATDVAARGLDVDRISLVINYDISFDAESYVHRIGRTGRAGRSGKAILFVEYKERRLLKNIEQLIKKQILQVEMPKAEELEKSRRDKFANKIEQQLEHADLEKYKNLLEDLFANKQYNSKDISAAMLMLLQGNKKLILPADPIEKDLKNEEDNKNSRNKNQNKGRDRERNGNKFNMHLYRIELGKMDGVEVKHIVGAIANEGGINSRFIGHVKLYDEYSTVELPEDMPKELVKHFTKTRILQKPMKMTLIDGFNNKPNKENKINKDKVSKATKPTFNHSKTKKFNR